MSHLGSRLTALVDGELAPAAAERVLAHVAACRECAVELAAVRSSRRALGGSVDVPPGLTERLLALGPVVPPADDPTGAGDGSGHGAGAAFTGSVRLPGDGDDLAHGSLRGEIDAPRRVPARLTVALTAGAGAVVVGLAGLGAQPAVVPPTERAHALALLSEAVTVPAPAGTPTWTAGMVSPVPWGAPAGEVTAAPSAGHATVRWDGIRPAGLVRDVDLQQPAAAADVLAWMRQHGWAGPAHLPEEYRVAALRLDVEGSGFLELDMVGPDGTVVVTQQHGRLAEDVLREIPVVHVGGHRVHVLAQQPWHGVWQSGDTVVTVVADSASPALFALVRAWPAGEYDEGVPARIARGWDVVAGAWAP